MDFQTIKQVYFIGIGGIGMSALARFFKSKGKTVQGYDLTQTQLTQALAQEGISIHYEDQPSHLQQLHKEETLVIYTPAIPARLKELQYAQQEGFTLMKRAQVLGLISENKLGIAVAGTHGKTSVSSMIAYLLDHSRVGCDALVGGIIQNYQTNLVLTKQKQEGYIVVEADEFDRSFLQLKPYFSVITSLDADHLDIYKDKEDLKAAFTQFVAQTQDYGKVLVNKKVLEQENLNPMEIHGDIEAYTYSIEEGADFCPKHLTIQEGKYHFDLLCPNNKRLENLSLNYPGLINVENAVAASAVAYLSGATEDEIREALLAYKGVKRRMEYRIQEPNMVYIDDYAHHPTELDAAIGSVRKLYPNKKLTGVFQPHLYSRTQDFAKDFAKSLEALDTIILLDIYPARELPIEGVSSLLIFDQINHEDKKLISKGELLEALKAAETEVLLTLGAGNIGEMVPEIETLMRSQIV